LGFKDISFGAYKRLIGVAANSPIVEKGTPNQYMIGGAFFYQFRLKNRALIIFC
jgi:hypothetical protein